MQAFVPKTRRPKFELQLKIVDLNNVPLVSGTSSVKWDLPHSTSAEHRGRTQKCHIKDHKVTYDYEKNLTVKLTVDKSGMLQESVVHFEVIQEYSSGARGERITLGYVKLNLAEYVDASDGEGEEGVSRRYLMQDSKINSTLKIDIRMTLVDGDHNFTAPPLKTAPVFGGIAGIVTGETGDAEEAGHLPNLTSKSRETREIQDLYRRNLAAFWNALPGELRADDCIEDIFAGGDGWGAKATSSTQNGNGHEHHNGDEDRRGSSGPGGHGRHGSSHHFFGTDDDEDSMTSSSHHQKSPRHINVPWVSRFHMHHRKEPSFGSSGRTAPRESRMSTSSLRSDFSQRDDDDPHSATGLSQMTSWSTGSTAGFSPIDENGGGTGGGGRKSIDDNNGGAGAGRSHSAERELKGGSIDQHAREMKAEAASGRYRARNEVDEFDLREDLKSWGIGQVR